MLVQWLPTAIFSMILSSCFIPAMPKHDPKVEGFREGTVNVGGRQVRTLESGVESEGAREIVLVHGSPGGADGWSEYLADGDLKKAYRVIAYDRLGFGGTGRPSGRLFEHVDVLLAIMDSQEGRVDLVGHSYGGAVVLKAAAMRPEKTGNVLVLAGSVAPGLSKTASLNSFVKYSGFQFLLPGAWKSSNEEVIALQKDLREMEAELGKVEAPVTIIQGRRDPLVVPAHVDYLNERLKDEPEVIFLEDEGHFLPWKRFTLIREVLLKFRESR